MRRTLPLFLFIFLLAACAPAAASAVTPTSKTLTPFTFMAGYQPQADLPFVGVYVAKEKGFFEEEGLDVTIQHSTGSGSNLQLLAAGEIQVTTQDAAVLLQRRADPGLPLVSIALIGQKGQQAYAALQSSGFTSPKDWEGHTVGYKGTPPPDLFALLHAAGADPDKVDLVSVGYDPRLLTEGKVDVYPVFNSNEPYLIRSWGYNIDLWSAADYGLPSLGLTYVTSQDTLDSRADDLTHFLRAAFRGIDYAQRNPDEAIQIVMKYAGDQADPALQRFMMDIEMKDAQSPLTEQYGIGWQTLDQWQNLADMLAKYQAMPQVDASQAFTTQILEAARK
jgi:ABC-type nitrate/sulfonate/bicarbonate transport system substrate-binding protein